MAIKTLLSGNVFNRKFNLHAKTLRHSTKRNEVAPERARLKNVDVSMLILQRTRLLVQGKKKTTEIGRP